MTNIIRPNFDQHSYAVIEMYRNAYTELVDTFISEHPELEVEANIIRHNLDISHEGFREASLSFSEVQEIATEMLSQVIAGYTPTCYEAILTEQPILPPEQPDNVVNLFNRS